jgi:hypothetical protein
MKTASECREDSGPFLRKWKKKGDTTPVSSQKSPYRAHIPLDRIATAVLP